MFCEPTVASVTLANIGFIFGPPPLDLKGRPDIIPGMGAGAKDVVDGVLGSTGGRPPQPPFPPVPPAGDHLQGPELVEQAVLYCTVL